MKIFNLPDLGEGLPDAEIYKWYVQEGDIVAEDQPLVAMETAKAVVDVPAPYPGKISKLFGKQHDIIKTNSPLIAFDAEDTSNTVVGEIISGDSMLNEQGSLKVHKSTTNTIKATPAVRALAKQLNIDLQSITPTGKNGSISINDLQLYNDNNKGQQLTGVKRAMALTMQDAQQNIVPVTLTEDAIFSTNTVFTDITVTIIQAIIKAIQQEPNVNSHFDGTTLQLKPIKDINLGIAMDSPDGLFVPVIHAAQTLDANELRNIINEYKNSVRERKIDQKSLQNPTFTISNFGTIAGKYSNPIVVPPMVGILGIGKIREIVTPINQVATIGKMIPFSFTFDHRALTGGEAARFIQLLIRNLPTLS